MEKDKITFIRFLIKYRRGHMLAPLFLFSLGILTLVETNKFLESNHPLVYAAALFFMFGVFFLAVLIFYREWKRDGHRYKP